MKQKTKNVVKKDDSDEESIIKVKMAPNTEVKKMKAGEFREGLEKPRSHTASNRDSASSRASSPARSESSSDSESSSSSSVWEPTRECGSIISRDINFNVSSTFKDDVTLREILNEGLSSLSNPTISGFNRLFFSSADLFIKKCIVKDPGHDDEEITIRKGYLQEVAGMVALDKDGQIIAGSEMWIELHENSVSNEEEEGHLFFVGCAKLDSMTLSKDSRNGNVKGVLVKVGIPTHCSERRKEKSCSRVECTVSDECKDGMQMVFESDIHEDSEHKDGVSVLSLAKTARKFFQKETKLKGMSEWDRVLVSSLEGTLRKPKGSVLGHNQESCGKSLKNNTILAASGLLRLDLFDNDDDGAGVHQKIHVEISEASESNADSASADVLYRGPLDARLSMIAGKVTLRAVLLPKKKKAKKAKRSD
eukprot:GDKJ01042384.1.p1 GENE.GDKJ01042384.1~~GDKJ01042384.1.p1  ORF type:complete len:492 (-),score=119.86 GDKJ01042384.1:142-1404(-)